MCSILIEGIKRKGPNSNLAPPRDALRVEMPTLRALEFFSPNPEGKKRVLRANYSNVFYSGVDFFRLASVSPLGRLFVSRLTGDLAALKVRTEAKKRENPPFSGSGPLKLRLKRAHSPAVKRRWGWSLTPALHRRRPPCTRASQRQRRDATRRARPRFFFAARAFISLALRVVFFLGFRPENQPTEAT